jgi:hypothetical protein
MKFRMMTALPEGRKALVGRSVLMMGLVAGVLATGAGQARAQAGALAGASTSGVEPQVGALTGASTSGVEAEAGALTGASASGVEAQAVATASGKLAPAAPVTYANRWELYGGLSFMNFQAGQALPKRMNMGGVDASGTYWINRKWGATANYRGEWGTTPVLANPYVNRPLVYMNMALFGAQYRGPKNQHVAVNYHAYGGMSYGVFDFTLKNAHVPPEYDNVGLYTNRWAPMFALGGSIDFNRSKKLAIRLSPDMILEHFGTETRVFVSVSGGVMYRFGSK